MDFDQYLPKDAVSYISCVRQLASLLNKAMDEVIGTEFVSDSDKNRSLQRLADGVETVACLRGDSGIFYAARPDDMTEYQEEMYKIEDALRARLASLGYTHPQS